MDSKLLEIDTRSPFNTYKLDCRRNLARKLALKFKSKPVINFIRQIGGLRNCKIADVEVYGTKMRVYPGMNRSDKIMLGMPHTFDANERRLLAEQLAKTPNPSFIDIGANIGAYSAFASGLGLNVKTVAIEADPEMFARLNFNLGDKVTKLNIAVADKEGVLPFYLNDHNRGENSLVASNGRKIEVPAKTLKQILDEQGIERPTAMKIDVEGMETVILKAFFDSVDSSRYPQLIISEHIHNNIEGSEVIKTAYKVVFSTKLNNVYVLI
jgi:FkbM family methyltransferase